MNESSLSRLVSFINNIDLSDFFISRLYPAPPAVDLMRVDIEGLSIEEIRKQLSEEELWQAGNHFLKQRQFILADVYYEHALKKNKELLKVRALRGLVRLCLGEYKKANTILSKILLNDTPLEDARLWLAYIRFKEEKLRSVSHQLNLVIKHGGKQSSSSALYILRAMLSIKTAKIDEAEKALHEGLLLQDEYVIRYILACMGFLKGEELFRSGDFKNSIYTWVRYASLSGDAWTGISDIVVFFNSLSKDAAYKKKLSDMKKQLSDSKDKELFYWYVCYLLCGLSLLPEFYESYESIEERTRFWKAKSRASTSYPYAHFCYALCLLYGGHPDEAYEELMAVRDKIPASKKGYFKIDQLIDLTAEFNETEKGFDSGFVVV